MSGGDSADTMATLSRGDELEPFEVGLTSDDVSAYLAATGESVEAWLDAVPPLAIGALALGGLMERTGIPEGLLHTGQEFSFVRAVPHGAAVEVRISVGSASERRGALMVAFDLELSEAGEVVATGRTSIIVTPSEGTEVAE